MLRCVCVFVLTVGLALGGAAQADAQTRQRWNGPYVGFNLGHGWADISGSVSVLDQGGNPVFGPDSYGIDANGMFGGVQAGFNRRIGNFFFGLEGDLQTAGISGSSSISAGGYTFVASASVDWFATARVRGGFASDTMLVYATGGLALAGLDYDATFKTGNTSVHLSNDGTHFGLVLGAGLEMALRSNWSLKIEYQYLNFGSQSANGAYAWSNTRVVDCWDIVTTGTNSVSSSVDTDIHTVRIGLNYALGTPPPRHEPLKP
jgi:outer membrane immunogenic protein